MSSSDPRESFIKFTTPRFKKLPIQNSTNFSLRTREKKKTNEIDEKSRW